MTWPWIIATVAVAVVAFSLGVLVMGRLCAVSRAHERLTELDHTFLSRSTEQ